MEKKEVVLETVREVSKQKESAINAPPSLDMNDIFEDDPDYKPNKRYNQKLELFILSYSLLSYGLKSIDVSNVSNAYLGLHGQERNLFTTFFNIGYLVGSTPSQIIINRIRPSLWIPSCELVWSCLVMGIAAANNAKTLQIYGLRFLLGVFESCSYPGFAYILGSWHGPDELAKRMGVYDLAGYAAKMVGGSIQAGIYSGLNGVHGIAGWRWMLIIDGCMVFQLHSGVIIVFRTFPTTQEHYGLPRKIKSLEWSKGASEIDAKAVLPDVFHVVETLAIYGVLRHAMDFRDFQLFQLLVEVA
ncbi:major facilitator superfamily domain-containing protein [Lipomyces starkeyi]